MKPLIQKGDWVFIEPSSNRLGFQKGEIVLIDRGMDFVIHRLIRINGSEIITRGDWSRFSDPQVKLEQILGQVIEIEKHGYRIRLNHPLIRIFNRIIYSFSFFYRKFYFNKGAL
ncbi:MAG: S24/S26 family peptidase [Anaerolineaceae bacterium]|nr:S24/S26 family peptidase [Anaerolineaceae bacterium]